GEGEAGVLARVTGPAVGRHAQRGYMAAVRPADGSVVLGKFDGKNWHERASAPIEGERRRAGRLTLRAKGDELSVWWRGTLVLQARDSSFTRGTVGIRVGEAAAVFRDFTAAEPPSTESSSTEPAAP